MKANKFLLVIIVSFSLVGCSQNGITAIDNEQSISNSIETDKFQGFVGKWQLASTKTEETLKEYGSLQEMFGTGLGKYGSELKIDENGKFSFYIGIGVNGEGKCEIENNILNVQVTPLENHGEGTELLVLALEQDNAVDYIVMNYYGETIYWSKVK